MDIFVGTSGWAYRWNKGGLDWYTRESGFNAIELNTSFYRLPKERMVESWLNKSKDLHWIVKASRMITHIYKFSEEAVEFWSVFSELFKSLKDLIDFYLFQLPPSIKPDSLNLIEDFFSQIKLTGKAVLEARSIEWFTDEYVDWARRSGLIFASVDSPSLPLNVYNVNGIIYMRMHGRKAWYRYRYSNQELEEVATKILNLNPKKIYVFFNNGDGMLENGRFMLGLLRESISR
ncbi:MAG: DUF72 domain-containing protein [Nitrososphaerota archaeon]